MVSQRSRWVLGLMVLAAPVVLAQTASGVFGGMLPVAQQQQPSDGPTGSVAGRVMAQDTGRPVRFAQVMLQLVPAAVPGGAPTGGGGRAGGFGIGNVNTRTDIEGNFTAIGVAPGDYWVSASAPGYIPENTLLQAEAAAGADPAALLAALPVAHVAADATSTVTVTIERGGTISGRVLWEDGSPAAGVSLSSVTATPVPPSPALLQIVQLAGGFTNFGSTDDRGAFRITGLPTGDYLLRAQLQVTGQQVALGRVPEVTSLIRVYSPGVYRKAQAKVVSVQAGDERSDVRMVIDLRGLHTVTGHAISTSAGQSVAAGRVALTDPNDRDLQLQGSINAQGDFTVRYVPEGSYNLQVFGASTVAGSGFGGRGRGGASGGTSFQPFTQPLTMPGSDLSGVAVTLTPVQ